MKVLCSLLVALLLPPGAGAQEPDPGTLVQAFVDHGLWPGGWMPGHAFKGCPDLEPWQAEAFRLLRQAKLTPERLDDLALGLSGAFARCGNGELESWYFAEMERLASSDNSFWRGIQRADNTPRIMARLYEWMAAERLPPGYRYRAAGEYFAKLDGDEERLRAFIDAHERGILFRDHAGLWIQHLAVEIPEQTLAEMGRVAREQPDRWLNDLVFELLLSPRTLRNASSNARAAFVRDVRAAIGAARALSDDRRKHLEAALAGLEED